MKLVNVRCVECLEDIARIEDAFRWERRRRDLFGRFLGNLERVFLCRGCAGWRRDGAVEPVTSLAGIITW